MPRSLLKECLEAARRGQSASTATYLSSSRASSSCSGPPLEQDAGFLAGLEVASIVAHGSGSVGSRSVTPGGTVVSASVSFAPRATSFSSLPAAAAAPPSQRQLSASFSQQQTHAQQLFTPSSSLGVSPPMRPPVPLPPTATANQTQQQQRCSSAFPGGSSPTSSSAAASGHDHHRCHQQQGQEA